MSAASEYYKIVRLSFIDWDVELIVRSIDWLSSDYGSHYLSIDLLAGSSEGRQVRAAGQGVRGPANAPTRTHKVGVME